MTVKFPDNRNMTTEVPYLSENLEDIRADGVPLCPAIPDVRFRGWTLHHPMWLWPCL